MPDYPTLRFLERHGGWIAIVIALAPPAAGIVAALLGGSVWWLAAGIAAGAVLFVIARSYVELIRLMTDMLLPK